MHEALYKCRYCGQINHVQIEEDGSGKLMNTVAKMNGVPVIGVADISMSTVTLPLYTIHLCDDTISGVADLIAVDTDADEYR